MDLKHITNSSLFIEYNPSKFSGVIWKHKSIGTTLLLFSNGKFVCIGGKSFKECKKACRRYGRLLQKLGYAVKIQNMRVSTISAAYTLQGHINLKEIAHFFEALYEPEIIVAARFLKEGIHYTCFYTGKVIITGIKSIKDFYQKVPITLLELETFVKSI